MLVNEERAASPDMRALLLLQEGQRGTSLKLVRVFLKTRPRGCAALVRSRLRRSRSEEFRKLFRRAKNRSATKSRRRTCKRRARDGRLLS